MNISFFFEQYINQSKSALNFMIIKFTLHFRA